jgi:hypothetical protein
MQQTHAAFTDAALSAAGTARIYLPALCIHYSVLLPLIE